MGDDEDAKAMAEIVAIEEQLNGIEKYAMYFMEQENAEVAAEQLRVAEVLSYEKVKIYIGNYVFIHVSCL